MTRVLLVEDEPDLADPLAYLLGREGFEVEIAEDGPSALTAFRERGADIVLLDLMLPGMPGTEVCRQIRVNRVKGITLWSRNQLYGSVLFTRSKPFNEEELQILELLAEPLHSNAAAPVIAFANKRLNLTQGESRCLASAAEGKTSHEIAGDTGYTTETVNFYLKSTTKKLGAANRTQAVVYAIRRKLI